LKNEHSLLEAIDKYWPVKPKELTYSGSMEQFNELELQTVVDYFTLWREEPPTNNHYSFKSKRIIEFKNEFLELLNMPLGKDYLVYLYSDDCPKCDE